MDPQDLAFLIMVGICAATLVLLRLLGVVRARGRRIIHHYADGSQTELIGIGAGEADRYMHVRPGSGPATADDVR